MNCWPFSKLRQKALEVAINHVHYANENSRYFCYGSPEKVIEKQYYNTLVIVS